MVDEASDEGLSAYVHALLDEHDLGRMAKGKVVIRQRIRDALNKLKADVDQGKRNFKMESNSLDQTKQELNEALCVIAAIHPDGFSAFSKYGNLRTCQDAHKLWDAVREKVNITHKAVLEFEVEAKAEG